MLLGLALDLFKGVLGIGKDALERSSKRKDVQLEADTRIAVARAEAEVARLNKAQDAEVDWDQTVATQMDHTWKDEFWTLLLAFPLILVFMGEWGRERVASGFAALQGVPDWYMWSVLTAIAASFGFRALASKFGIKK